MIDTDEKGGDAHLHNPCPIRYQIRVGSSPIVRCFVPVARAKISIKKKRPQALFSSSHL
jgi:hypothetical protein